MGRRGRGRRPRRRDRGRLPRARRTRGRRVPRPAALAPGAARVRSARGAGGPLAAAGPRPPGGLTAPVVRARGAAPRRLLPRGYGFAIAGIAVGMAGLVALGAL